MGLFGGSVDEAVQGVVDAYLDYFDDYFENLGVQVQQAANDMDCFATRCDLPHF